MYMYVVCVCVCDMWCVICGDVCVQCKCGVWYMYMGGGVMCACGGEREVLGPRLRITNRESI